MATREPALMETARGLYQDGLTVEEVAQRVGRTGRTVRNWIQAEGWKQGGGPERAIEEQITRLALKTHPSEKELRRMEALTRSLTRLRKGAAKRGERADLERNKEKNKPRWFGYQQTFMDDPALLRMVRKSRQIGFTRTIAFEGLERALELGRDQGFVSASLRQVAQLNRFVKSHGREFFGLKLRGTDTIKLPNDAELHFLPANPATIQGFSGDMYFDEFAWMLRAREIYENAAANATLGDYRITISSTPSVHSHYYEELWDPGRTTLPISRHQVSVIDAIESGNDLIDLGKLLALFRPEAIRRLYMCETLDDAGSVFGFDEVMACVHDDETLFERREDDEIWGGLDISRWRDDTSVVLLATRMKGDRRLFDWRECIRMSRIPLPVQSERVLEIIDDWKPSEFTIDQTTIGEHLADEVESEMPEATLVRFNTGSKARMVINAQDIVRGRRLRMPFDQRVIDSFLAIKRKSLETDIGYDTDGHEAIGHADDFWAFALAAYPDWGGGADHSLILI